MKKYINNFHLQLRNFEDEFVCMKSSEFQIVEIISWHNTNRKCVHHCIFDSL